MWVRGCARVRGCGCQLTAKLLHCFTAVLLPCLSASPHDQTASLLYCFTTSLLYFFPASLFFAYFLPRFPLFCPPLPCFFVTLLPGYLLHWQFNSTFPCGNSVVNVVLPHCFAGKLLQEHCHLYI